MNIEELGEIFYDKFHHLPLSNNNSEWGTAFGIFREGYELSQPNWIDASKELPPLISGDDDEHASEQVLGCDVKSGHFFVNSVQYNFFSKTWRVNGDYLNATVNVTHWMKHPKLPKI